LLLMAEFLDSRHLRLIAEIANAQSVTRAADRLHVTQSAVSHQLRDLEEKLGTPLFLRSGRRMLPTAAGTHLAETARRVLEDISRAEAAVGGSRAGMPASSGSAPSAIPVITGCPRPSRWSGGGTPVSRSGSPPSTR
jgi:DNA-binding transcriptional LysR family regulator